MHDLPYGAIIADRTHLHNGRWRRHWNRGVLTIVHEPIAVTKLPGCLCLFAVMNSGQGNCVDSPIHAVWPLFDCVAGFDGLREIKNSAFRGTPTPSEQSHVTAIGSIQHIESNLHAAHKVGRGSGLRPSFERGSLGTIRGKTFAIWHTSYPVGGEFGKQIQRVSILAGCGPPLAGHTPEHPC